MIFQATIQMKGNPMNLNPANLNPTLKAALIVVLLSLGGCAASYKANTYQGGQAQQAMRVKLATVIEIRNVEINAPSTGTGASVGAAAGGVLGTYTDSSRDGILSGLAGALIGGVIGNAAEKAVNTKQGIEITYRLEDTKEVMALVQEQDEVDPIKVGDRIKIVEGATTRATKLAANAGL